MSEHSNDGEMSYQQPEKPWVDPTVDKYHIATKICLIVASVLFLGQVVLAMSVGAMRLVDTFSWSQCSGLNSCANWHSAEPQGFVVTFFIVAPFLASIALLILGFLTNDYELGAGRRNLRTIALVVASTFLVIMLLITPVWGNLGHPGLGPTHYTYGPAN